MSDDGRSSLKLSNPNLSEELPLNVLECVKNVVKKEGYTRFSVSKKVLTPDGGGFLGILSKVDVKGETNEGDKETNLFLKSIVHNDRLTLLSMPEAYKRELFVYKELSKVFNELQEEANIPLNERYRFVDSYAESDLEVIILDNMTKKGFTTLNRMNVPSLEFVELAIKALAKFHALSFALEEKRPHYYEDTIKIIKQPFNFDKDRYLFVRNMSEITLNYLHGTNKEKLKAFIPTIFEKQLKYLTETQTRRCLCHCDYRPCNILIREIDGKLTDLIPIDYQFIFFGCPLLDFIYFIFSATDQDIRRKHLAKLKDLYYNTLKIFLEQFDMDINMVYTRDEFERTYEKKLDFGLIISLYVIPFVMAKADEIPDVTKDAMSALKFDIDDRMQERMTGIVNDFIEWGYL